MASPQTAASIISGWNSSCKRFVVGGSAKFFGLESASEDASKQVWQERRRRLAIKRFGGVKDEYQIEGNAYYNNGQPFRNDRHITSEWDRDLDKMVLKITKPPRDKDSLSRLVGQGMAWMVNVSTPNVPF